MGGFRRRRDGWDEFLKRHGAELRACGVPDAVTRDRGRFLRFLEHGFDQDGGFANRPSVPWTVEFLAPPQAHRLAVSIASHFGEEPYPDLLRALRARAGSGAPHVGGAAGAANRVAG